MNSIVLTIFEKENIIDLNIIDIPEFLEFVVRFTLNLVVLLILARWLYYTTTRRKDYMFTYILISILIFLLCYLLESVKLQIGFALGLFATFRIIKYRTDPIPIKEMTYLFLIIGLSVINALTNVRTSLIDLLFTNFIVVLITYAIEKLWLLKHESSKLIVYEKIDLVKSGKHDELLKDIQNRTGINKINRVEVVKFNFLSDTCDLLIYYYNPMIKGANAGFNGKGNNDN